MYNIAEKNRPAACRSVFLSLFILFCEYPASEKDDIHHSEEEDEDDEYKVGVFGRECCKEHHWESERDRRERGYCA